MICTFFGHRDTPKEIEPTLRSTLTDLIENKNVNLFYVGTQGNFDRMVYSQLENLSTRYSISYYKVLAYFPKEQVKVSDSAHTLLPDGFEKIYPRFAVNYRNMWMLKKSDYVVTYVTHAWGGAAKCRTLAEKQGKTVIDLCPIL